MKTEKRIKTIVLLTVMIVFIMTIHGQTSQEELLFSRVPPSVRARLIERLKLLEKHQSSQNWEALYSLLSVTFTQGKTKDEFIKLNQDWYAKDLGNLLVKFEPKSITIHEEASKNSGWLAISGCGKFRKNGSVMELYSGVEARREDGDWYFSEIGVITLIDGPSKPCLGVRFGDEKNSMQKSEQSNFYFAPVPASQRAGLIERLKLLVTYQREQQWGKQYDLLSVLNRLR